MMKTGNYWPEIGSQGREAESSAARYMGAALALHIIFYCGPSFPFVPLLFEIRVPQAVAHKSEKGLQRLQLFTSFELNGLNVCKWFLAVFGGRATIESSGGAQYL